MIPVSVRCLRVAFLYFSCWNLHSLIHLRVTKRNTTSVPEGKGALPPVFKQKGAWQRVWLCLEPWEGLFTCQKSA